MIVNLDYNEQWARNMEFHNMLSIITLEVFSFYRVGIAKE